MAAPPGSTPEEVFRQKLEDMDRVIQELVSRPMYIPIVQVAPDASYAGNIWAYPDGRIVIKMKDGTIRQVATSSATAPSGTNPTPPAQPITRVGEWGAQWTQAYRASGGFTGGNNAYLYYGNSGESSFNGRQKSLIGFDYAAIATALSGSQIVSVELYLYNLHTWFYNGATCFVGAHSNATKPGTYGGVVHDFISSFHTSNGGANAGEWHSISNEFGSRLRDGSAKGVILQAPNDSTAYYGYAAGIGSNSPLPQIRITYIK
jgi:hypothetical protein